MASRRAPNRFAKLWQMPMLVVSLALFGYAAYLFIDPKFSPSISQRIELAQALVQKARFEPALEVCNALLATGKLNPADEAHVHLLLAQILEGAQKQRHIDLASNNKRIIEQTRLALAGGEKESSDLYRRLGNSQLAIEHPIEAMESYKKAIALDPNHAPALQRKMIELQLAQEDTTKAEPSIEAYLKVPGLSRADRAWALVEKAQALARRDLFSEAKPVFIEALKVDPEPATVTVGPGWLGLHFAPALSTRQHEAAQGTANYWLGYCTWKLGDAAEAERVLRVARDQLTVAEPLDADAAYALGRIRQQSDDPKEAISFYQEILRSHPASHAAPLARLRRGQARITLDEDEAALSDLHTVVTELTARKNFESYKAQTVEGLQQSATALTAKGNFTGAVEALEAEQTLVPDPPPAFFGRLANVFERRAEQVEQTIASAGTAEEKASRQEQVAKLRMRAGDAYIALSRGMTLADDRAQGDAMWKGVDLYDRAGAMPQSISAMETFVSERPDDSTTPDVLLRLGRAYQATGQFDKAISALQRNQFRYPQSLAASKSGVPLAQAFVAKGPAAYPQAEKVLISVLENPIVTPEAEEFRLALFELAQLYYRTGRYEEAISRLEETTQRYPNDSRMAQLLFLMADSYRKSAGLLGEKLAARAAQPANPVDAAAAAAVRTEAIAARQDRLIKARILFARIVDLAHANPPARDLDKLYLKLSHFYRADCLYDLGEYEEAIHHYDAATLRYQEDPSSVAAYVQIVNAYCRLGRLDEARNANERAKWLLRRMPAEAFAEGRSSVPKKYWEDWLKLTSDTGLYAKDLQRGPLSDAR